MEKHKVMFDIVEDRIIFAPGYCKHNWGPKATLLPKPQTSESQSDHKPNASTFSTFSIKQIEVAALAAAITSSTLAPTAPPAFKVKKKKKPKLHTGAAKLTLIPEDKEPKVLDIAEISASAFYILGKR